MPTAAPAAPPVTATVYDDPDMPGRYMTDGVQLFRLLGPAAVRRNYVEIEDCMTLEVWLVDSRELRSWGVTTVCPREMAFAA